VISPDDLAGTTGNAQGRVEVRDYAVGVATSDTKGSGPRRGQDRVRGVGHERHPSIREGAVHLELRVDGEAFSQLLPTERSEGVGEGVQRRLQLGDDAGEVQEEIPHARVHLLLVGRSVRDGAEAVYHLTDGVGLQTG
jgi:hypothetical protein